MYRRPSARRNSKAELAKRDETRRRAGRQPQKVTGGDSAVSTEFSAGRYRGKTCGMELLVVVVTITVATVLIMFVVFVPPSPVLLLLLIFAAVVIHVPAVRVAFPSLVIA